MSETREPLKAMTPSGIRPPVRVTKADFPVETVQDMKENNPSSLNQSEDQKGTVKRKKTEADLRESLRQRKMTTTTTLNTTAKKPKTDLNQTLSSYSKRNLLATTTVTAKPTLTRTKSASSLNKTLVVTADTSKKRPAWDIKGRLEDMEKLTELLKSEVKRNQDNVHGLQTQLVDRENQISTIKETKSTLEMHVDGSKKELESAFKAKLELQNKIVELQQQHNSQMQDLLYKHRSLETVHQTTVSSLNMSKAENESLRLTVDTQRGQISALQCELDSLKSSLASAENLCKDRKRKIEEMEIQIDEKNRNIEELEAEIRQADDLRKKLHNTIQELKGNIRVFCRVRPLLGAELQEFANAPPTFEYPNNNDRIIDISTSSLSGITGVKSDKKFTFTYDKVFQSNSTQDAVFSEISQLVQSALDGYNTCIFAYGQTGSGKTYTMEGPGIDSELDMPIVDTEKRGMIPRAVEQIFQSAEALKDKGWSYEMEVNYLEIYNETIRDLLCPQNNLKEDIKYEIKHDNKGNTTVTNMTVMKVRNPSQVYDLLRRASKNRAVSKTNMNEHSSRSHSVFQLKLNGVNSITNDQVRGILNLIDLAGSERLDKSGVTGQHLKETQSINKSLSSLGDVIAALGNKESHIPYRNSKLTYLLQNSLGGNSKTLMFVNISPRPTDLNESISSLRFATKVNSCEIGTAKKQAKMDMKAL